MAQIEHVLYCTDVLREKLTFASPSRFAEKRTKLAFSQISLLLKIERFLSGKCIPKAWTVCVSLIGDFTVVNSAIEPQQSDRFLNSLPLSQFH